MKLLIPFFFLLPACRDDAVGMHMKAKKKGRHCYVVYDPPQIRGAYCLDRVKMGYPETQAPHAGSSK